MELSSYSCNENYYLNEYSNDSNLYNQGNLLTDKYWENIYEQKYDIKYMFQLCEHIMERIEHNTIINQDSSSSILVKKMISYYRNLDVYNQHECKTELEYIDIFINHAIITSSLRLLDYIYKSNPKLSLENVILIADKNCATEAFKWAIRKSFDKHLFLN